MFQSRNNSTVHLCPCILRPTDHHAYYGGSQEWFTRNTAFIGGCASVCGVNVLAICAENNPIFQELLGISINAKRVISIEDYTRVMHELYNTITMLEVPVLNRLYDNSKRELSKNMIPASLGTTLFFFIRGMKRYSKSHNIKLNSHVMYTMNTNYMRSLTYIKLALSNGHPVVLLTTQNHFEYTLFDKAYFQGGSSETMSYRFVTITDIQSSGTKDNPDLIISTGGKNGKISYKDLYESWQSLSAFGSGMVYFTSDLIE